MPVIPSEREGSKKEISPGVYPEFAEGVEMTTIPDLASLRPFDFAQDMLGERNRRIRESSTPCHML